jgi:hypothetical protein
MLTIMEPQSGRSDARLLAGVTLAANLVFNTLGVLATLVGFAALNGWRFFVLLPHA